MENKVDLLGETPDSQVTRLRTSNTKQECLDKEAKGYSRSNGMQAQTSLLLPVQMFRGGQLLYCPKSLTLSSLLSSHGKTVLTL